MQLTHIIARDLLHDARKCDFQMREAFRRGEEGRRRQEGGGGEILFESADEAAGGAEQADGEHPAEDGGRAPAGGRLPVRLRRAGRGGRVRQEHAQEDAQGEPLWVMDVDTKEKDALLPLLAISELVKVSCQI